MSGIERDGGGGGGGCAIGVGLIFASLLKSVSYAPDYDETLFNYAALGFAFVESFSFLLFFVAIAIFAFST